MRTLAADHPLGVTITVDRLRRDGRHACAAEKILDICRPCTGMYSYVAFKYL